MKTIKKLMIISIGTLLLGSTLGCVSNGVDMTQEELKDLIADKMAEGNAEGYKNGINSVDITSDNQGAITSATVEKDKEIAELKSKSDKDALVISDYEAAEKEVANMESSYKIDELKIGDSFSEEVSDREVSVLYDGEIRFDGDSYDMEEVAVVGGSLEVNKEDYGNEAYLEILSGDLSYTVIFENDLDTSSISEDNSLEFNFLGNNVEITEWNVDEVTFTKGTTYLIEKGQTMSIEGKQVTLVAVGDDYVYVKVDDRSEKIMEGDTEEVSGIEIKASTVLNNEVGDGDDFAELKISEDVLYEIEDGDDYEDSNWIWKIDANSIGIVLDQDYNDLDEDEKPLKSGESISWPHQYVSMAYNGMVIDSYEKVSIESDSKYDLEINGNFKQGTKDYNEIYLNASGIYDEDDELIDATQIEIDGTDGLYLVTDYTTITINNVDIPVTLDDVLVSANSISSYDEGDYVTSYGIIIENVEDSVEDADKWVLQIPEEEQELEVTIY